MNYPSIPSAKVLTLSLGIVLLLSFIPLPSSTSGGDPVDTTTWPPALPSPRFLPRVNIVHLEETTLSTEYDFLASIPLAVFHYNDLVYQSLLISDDLLDTATEYIREDFATYLEDWNGCQHINFIGDIPLSTKTILMTEFNTSWNNCTNITGDPLTVANEIALHDWSSTEKVVIAPYITTPTSDDIHSISNAAVIASLHNAPLLYTDPAGLSSETLGVIHDLDATSALLVEINDTLSSTISSQLQGMGITLEADFTTASSVVTHIMNQTGYSLLCAIIDNWQNLPASLYGARYGGYILGLPDNIVDQANLIFQSLNETNQSFYKLETPVDIPLDIRANEQTLAQYFYTWLQGMGGVDPDNLEMVTTFHTQPYYDPSNGLAVTFDRAISGDPAYPTLAGAITGRMPLEFLGNIAVANRGGLYTAVIHSNPRSTHITLCMDAYEARHDNSFFDDNYGDDHVVNEIFGWPSEGWTSSNNFFPWPPSGPDLDPLWPPAIGSPGHNPGAFSTLATTGYEPHFHSGSGSGSGHHGSQPSVDLIGFVNDVDQGSVYLYISCHGGGTSISVASSDTGIYEDVPFGDPYWPASDGRVNYSPGSYSQTQLNNDLHNTHSLIIGYNACGMSNGKMNEILLQHGGIGSIGSYTSVSFDGSGWWWNLFGYLITQENYTLGEATAYASARVADIYTPGHIVYGDGSLNYVFIGDPLSPFSQPDWVSPQPSELGMNYGGHCPDGAFASSIQTFSLYTGWNLITIPLDTNLTAESLGLLIPDCTVVCGFNASTQSYTTHVVGIPYNDFPILDGIGYFIYILGDTVWTLEGTYITSVTVPIHQEWNLIGWPGEENTTASSLGDNILGATVICMFNAQTQQYMTHVVTIPIKDFTITRGMGLFLYATQETTWQWQETTTPS
jgi:hypothetical protein